MKGKKVMEERSFLRHAVLIAILSGMVFFPHTVFSGQWRVSPIKLTLSRHAKSGAVTVINEGSEKLHLQMKAAEWVQDAEGRDQYLDTSDLIFFPKIMVLDKEEHRLVRTGIRKPPSGKEKTYRLFIEEIPKPSKSRGANIAVVIKFGVPVFVKPLDTETKGEIRKIELDKGVLTVGVKNTGNEHFIVESIRVTGKNRQGANVFSRDLSGWYVLNGVTRPYTTTIPAEQCKKIRTLAVEVKTEGFTLKDTLDVTKAMCAP